MVSEGEAREGVVSAERREDEEREEEDGVVSRLGREESLVRSAGELERDGLSERFNSSAQFGPYVLSNQSDRRLSLFIVDEDGREDQRGLLEENWEIYLFRNRSNSARLFSASR